MGGVLFVLGGSVNFVYELLTGTLTSFFAKKLLLCNRLFAYNFFMANKKQTSTPATARVAETTTTNQTASTPASSPLSTLLALLSLNALISVTFEKSPRFAAGRFSARILAHDAIARFVVVEYRYAPRTTAIGTTQRNPETGILSYDADANVLAHTQINHTTAPCTIQPSAPDATLFA